MITLSRDDAQRSVDAVEEALKAGCTPPGMLAPRGALSAVRTAAKKLGVPEKTLRSRVEKDGPCEAHYGIGVDWSLYKAPEKPAPAADEPTAPQTAPDPLSARAASDKLANARRELAEAQRHAIKADGLRKAVFGLADLPFAPPPFKAPAADKHGKIAEAIILPISDIHMGEVIDAGAMGGRNSYSVAIATARIERYFSSVIKLGTEHWSGPKPCQFTIALMGDLVSGEIHDELAKTNDLQSIPATKAVAEVLAAGIDRLCEAFPTVPINVISLPGNHGRTVRKPEAKGFALNSYDTLALWLIESWFKAKPRKHLTFSAPPSGDAVVTLHGWNILFTHGDRIGARGGAGFVGVAATATRGMKRLIEDYAADNIVIDHVVIGHFHTPIELEYGFVNGSMVGPSEFSRSGQMKSHAASQWMLSVHPHHGIARRWKIQVGDPSEGSIYIGRAAA